MNLQETVSKMLNKEVSAEEALLFAKDQFGLLEAYLHAKNPRYPNGLTNWKETYYQFSVAIQNHLNGYEDNRDYVDVIFDTQDSQGQGGLWELADEWTNEFEKLHKGCEWDGEYFDEIDAFFDKKNKG